MRKKQKVLQILPNVEGSINAFNQLNSFNTSMIATEDFQEGVEIHNSLNSMLFENNTLKEEVRNKCLEIANSFKLYLKENNIDIDVKDIVLVGSNASYNYTKDSDIDIHLIVDSNTHSETLKLYNAYKALFNLKHDIKVKGYRVEIYVENEDAEIKSNGIYSIVKNDWVKFPSKLDNELPEYEALLDKYIKRFEEVEKNPTKEEAQRLIDDIYNERNTGLESEGEISTGNLIFKEFRNIGYLDTLEEILLELEDKQLTLEDLILAEDFNANGDFELFVSAKDMEDEEIKLLVKDLQKKVNSLSVLKNKNKDINALTKEDVRDYLDSINCPLPTLTFIELFDSVDDLKNVIKNREKFEELSAYFTASDFNLNSIAVRELGASVAQSLIYTTFKKNGAAVGNGELLCAVAFKDTKLSDSHSDLIVGDKLVELKVGKTPSVGPFRNSSRLYSSVQTIFEDILHFSHTNKAGALSTINFDTLVDKELTQDEITEINNILPIAAKTTKELFKELFMQVFNTYVENKLILICNNSLSSCVFLVESMNFDQINEKCKLSFSSLPGQTYSYGFKFQKR